MAFGLYKRTFIIIFNVPCYLTFTSSSPRQIKPKLLETVDHMLANDIARLMAMVPAEDMEREIVEGTNGNITGGAFNNFTESPFGVGRGEGTDEGRGEATWVVENLKYKYDEEFETLGPVDGKLSGAVAKKAMVKSKLPNTVLGKIWKLSDIDRDGFLDADEWALANHLMKIKLEGHDLPGELPEHLVPPSKQQIVADRS